MKAAVAASMVLAACGTGPGTIVSPIGTEPLRTALYRVGTVDGAPELVLVLSNGEVECGLPNFSDTNEAAEAVEQMVVAACREGAQHVALTLYALDPSWVGRYEGLDHAGADALSQEQPRVASGAYYGIEEAFLVELNGLDRGYAASDDLYLPYLGDAGEVRVTGEVDDVLEGWFSFPADQIAGEFRAERCTGDTSLIDNIAASPVALCQ